MNSEQEFEVTAPIKCDGKDYAIGDAFSHKDKKIIDDLQAMKVIKPKDMTTDAGSYGDKQTAPEDPAARKAAIVETINMLDKDDKTHWIGNGAPDANVLTELLGWKVKADERNQIWLEMNPVD